MGGIPISWNSSSLEAVHDPYKGSCYHPMVDKSAGAIELSVTWLYNRAACNLAILGRHITRDMLRYGRVKACMGV